MMKVLPVTLESDRVILKPLLLDYLPDLCKIGFYDEIWNPTGRSILTETQMRNYVETAISDHTDGKSLPFVTVNKNTNEIVGSTRFANIETAHRRVEIGWTWITPKWQRSYINTHAKYLMLKHAFEKWKCIRVELKTNVLNQKSRNAMLRIGAKEEGIFRNHMIQENGTIRNSVYFSIIDSEWPSVKENFETVLLKR